MKAAALSRVELIETSMRCFVLGLFSLLPVIGLPIAALVWMMNWRIQRRAAGAWNPAERYLRGGCVCASWGAFLSSLTAIVLGMIAAVSAAQR